MTAPQSTQEESFTEVKEPGELVMCIVIAAAYAGLAKYCWKPLITIGDLHLFFYLEGFLITIAFGSLFLGMRTYISPASLQLSKEGIKYRGPYWPQQKFIDWQQIFRLYVSPELIVVLYHPYKNKSIWPLIIQSVYLSEREQIPNCFSKYCPIEPILLSGPSLISRTTMIVGFAALVSWIILMLLR